MLTAIVGYLTKQFLSWFDSEYMHLFEQWFASFPTLSLLG